MGKKKVAVMNTAFRDGFQSVFGARVLTPDFLPALDAAKEAGFTHFEAGGGARYQALYLYCQENAFDMMDAFREKVGPEANLQTLSRGINVVGLDSQSSDVIDLHAKMFKKHGMTTIRNFDALNDVRNLVYSGQCIVDAGLKHEVVVTMMELPPGCSGAHSAEFYMEVLEEILRSEVPFSSVCFKDASGTAVPSKVYETIRLARKRLPEDTHIRIHTHDTAGIGVMQYRAALDAGVDGIDLAMKPVSGGTSQPDVITMWHALRGTDFEIDMDMEKVLEAEAVLQECLRDYFIPPEALAVEPMIPFSPMPGGALTANTQMMRDNQMMDRYAAVISKMGEVVRRGGFGTSVTPVSQFYFQQAFNNEIFGPWKRIADGYGKMVLGYFGRTPCPPDPEIVAIASEQLGLEPTTDCPRGLNDADPQKGLSAARRTLEKNDLKVDDENLFIAATCGEKGIAFLKGESPLGVRKNSPEKATSTGSDPCALRVTVGGETFLVEVRDGKTFVDGEQVDVSVDSDATSSGGGAGTQTVGGTTLRSDLAAKVLRVPVSEGQAIRSGDTVLVLEALKMEMEVSSPVDGNVSRIHVAAGEQVNAGADLVTIG